MKGDGIHVEAIFKISYQLRQIICHNLAAFIAHHEFGFCFELLGPKGWSFVQQNEQKT